MLREKRKLRSVQYARKKTLEWDGSFGDGTLPELCQNKNRTVRATFFAGKRDEVRGKVKWMVGQSRMCGQPGKARSLFAS